MEPTPQELAGISTDAFIEVGRAPCSRANAIVNVYREFEDRIGRAPDVPQYVWALRVVAELEGLENRAPEVPAGHTS